MGRENESRLLGGPTSDFSAAMRFDISKLKVARGSVAPKPAQTLLPDYALNYINHFDTLIERDTQSLQDVMADPSFPKPYWDPVLRNNRLELKKLLKILVKIAPQCPCDAFSCEAVSGPWR